MFRRPRRPRRPFFRRRPPFPPPRDPRRMAQQALRQAEAQMQQGNFAQAAEIFARLAEAAEAHGVPRAPQLHLRAAQAWLKAGDLSQAETHLWRGLEMLANAERWRPLAQVGQRVVRELETAGQAALAARVEDWLRNTLPADAPLTAPAGRPALPTHCPACGGPVRPDEVEWLDGQTAECAFCGSPIRAE